MARTTSDQVIDILVEAGINWACGVPGDAIDLMLGSIHRRDDFDFVLTRHEEPAGFMCSAYAKLTGRMGVVLASQGPGSAHMLNCMYDAKLDKVPMLVITGQVDSAVVGTNTVQEINQISLFEDAAFFNREVRTPENLIDIIQLAIQTALIKRCVAHVSICTDVLRMKAVKRMPSQAAFKMHSNVIPHSSYIQQAASFLNKHANITILYGGGAFHARDQLLQVADLLNAPIVHTVRSKDIVDNNNPHYAGGIGFKGSRNGCDTVKDCQALLIVGCSFAWREFYPENVPIIQIDLDPQRIGVRCHISVGLVGDARLTLEQLIPLLVQKSDAKFLNKAHSRHLKAITSLDKQAEIKENKLVSSPMLTGVISEQLTDNAIVTVDAGTVSVWANNWLRLNGTQRLIGSTELGTMGFGMPAALGCQWAHRDRQVVALCGDGGFQMVMGDFSTAIKYQLPIKVIIYNTFSYHFIELEQMKEGIAECYTKLHNPDYAKVAEAFGGDGFTITKPAEIEPVIKEAFASPRACLIDVHVNPNELIKPTHITAAVLVSFAKGMIKTKLSDSND